MKKSIKKFLVISQVLGLSTLLASACTDDQLKPTNHSDTSGSNKNNPTADSTEKSNIETDSSNKSKTNAEGNVSENPKQLSTSQQTADGQEHEGTDAMVPPKKDEKEKGSGTQNNATEHGSESTDSPSELKTKEENNHNNMTSSMGEPSAVGMDHQETAGGEKNGMETTKPGSTGPGNTGPGESNPQVSETKSNVGDTPPESK